MDLSNENIIHVKGNEIEYLQFKRLLKYSNEISHAYVVGLDKNFRSARENSKEMTNNYQVLCNELNLKIKNIVKANQTHTDIVECVDKNNSFTYVSADGLITGSKDTILSTTNADCILFLFYDPVKNVIANIHSGWRGTVQRISVKAIEKMKSKYNCNPKDIICCICPSIRKCHFEVDKDVYQIFLNEYKDINMDEYIEKKKNKWYIDTVAINKILLEREGLIRENIIDSGVCSVCNKEIIHSYRAEGKKFGLSTAIISLK